MALLRTNRSALVPGVVALAATVFLSGARNLPAQEPAASPRTSYARVIGEVTAIDAGAGKLTIKADDGSTSEIVLSDQTSYMSVPPGERDLKKAERIDLKDVQVGDRVLARSPKVEGHENGAATSVIVMSKTALAQQQAKTREEWRTRGAAGKIKSIDPSGSQVTLAIQTPAGLKDMIVTTDSKTVFRRYAPDSVRFADAKPSAFSDLAVGNSLRALGDKDADGAKIHAEEVVSGSFRNIAGSVISVDAANNEVKLNDLATKKPIVIKVNSDSTLKKLPPNVAMMLARMRQGGANAAGGHGETPGPPAAGSQPVPNRPEGAAAQGGASDAASSHPAWNGGAGSPGGNHQWGGAAGGGMGHVDMNQMMERLPSFSLSDLKPGDALIVTSTNGADPSRVTAIAVVAGVDPLLTASPSMRQGNLGGEWNFDIGMPQ